ncbi:MAG: chemotaxis-specific protein-glutamate methyltransferase CheB [Anaerolineae bacterium]
MPDEIRVLIAEDSPTVRQYLKTVISTDNGFRVVGEARDGAEAFALVQQLRPDVVTMDIQMPLVDGLEATRQIMSTCPTPVVIVSGVIGDEVKHSLDALESGALAVLPKLPERSKPEFPQRRQQLLQTLKAMSGVKVIARRDYGGVRIDREPSTPRPQPGRPRPEVVVMGASTGGPSALQRTLSALPEDYRLPIVIVQHMPDEFLGGLARWLRASSPLQVQMAYHGLELRSGSVYLAPGGAHLMLKRQGNRLLTHLEPATGVHRFVPSIDVLFESVAKACGASAAGVILTGMGDDGAEGLMRLRQAGAYTLAQNETSSTVYGMPHAALQRGAVERVFDLSHLPMELLKLL